MSGTWSDLEAGAPAVAEAGIRLLLRDGSPLAYLATIRWRDAGPRVHPICPILHDGRLWAFIVEMSTKYPDLHADHRFALHAAPRADGVMEEFYIDGRAHEVPAPEIRAEVAASTGGRLGSHAFERLFELRIDHALHTRWDDPDKPDLAWPRYARWRSTA